MRRILLPLVVALAVGPALGQRTHKPPLHGKDWMAVTGKPLGAAAGARIFIQGGNAVDAACAMLAATATMWDVLHWGGETQALSGTRARRRSSASTRSAWRRPVRRRSSIAPRVSTTRRPKARSPR